MLVVFVRSIVVGFVNVISPPISHNVTVAHDISIAVADSIQSITSEQVIGAHPA